MRRPHYPSHSLFFISRLLAVFVLSLFVQTNAYSQNFSKLDSPEEFRKIESIPDDKKDPTDWGKMAMHYTNKKQFNKTQDLIARWEKLRGTDRLHRLYIETARGVSLTLQEKPAEARDRMARAIQSFGPPNTPAERRGLSSALLTLGGALKDPIVRDYENAIRVYLVILNMGVEYKDPDLGLNALRAGYNAGLTYMEMRPPQYANAIKIYDDITRHFNFIDDRDARSIVAWSQINKGFALFKSNPRDPTLAVIVYDQLLNDFGSDKNPEIVEAIALALYNIGVMTAAASPPLVDHSLKFFDLVINRYSSNKSERIQLFVGNSIFFKAKLYDKYIQAHNEAKRLYTQFINSYGNSKHPDIVEHLHEAKARLKMLP